MRNLPPTREKHKRPQPRGVIKELREVSFAQYRAHMKRARDRRRIYARISSLPESTVREELLAIAQRHEFGDR